MTVNNKSLSTEDLPCSSDHRHLLAHCFSGLGIWKRSPTPSAPVSESTVQASGEGSGLERYVSKITRVGFGRV